MKWLGVRKVALKSIVLPGNFSATRAAPRITELATSIREHGLIGYPVVEAKTMRLVAGHDRVAALLALKESHAECRVVEGTARELRRMQIAENLHRRGDDAKALIAEYARAEEAAIIEEASSKVGTPVPPAQRVKQEANAAIAEARGIKPASVTKAKQRARQREERAAEPEVKSGRDAGPPAPVLPDGFQAFGLDVPHREAEAICGTVEWMSRLAGDVNRVLGELTKLEKDGRPVPRAALQSMRQLGQQFGHAIREAIPASLCWYCKGQPNLRTNCAGCGGTGVVGRHAGDHVPAELRRTDVVHVAINGATVPLNGNKLVPQPKRPGKHMRVEVQDADGTVRELTLDREGYAAAESEELF